jgi:hypothetical protein
VFHRKCGKHRVRHQRTGCAVVTDEFFQNLSMTRSGMHRNHARLSQPFAASAAAHQRYSRTGAGWRR